MCSERVRRAVVEMLRAHGAEDVEYEPGGGHPRLRFRHGGRRRVVVLPNLHRSRGGDRREHDILNYARQHLRRELGPPR